MIPFAESVAQMETDLNRRLHPEEWMEAAGFAVWNESIRQLYNNYTVKYFNQRGIFTGQGAISR